MRIRLLRVLLALCIVAPGCLVRSLQPLFTPSDLAVEPRLLGTWRADGDDEAWTVIGSGEKTYEVICRDGNKSTYLEGRLGKVDEILFLDITPKESDDAFSVPAHVFVRLEISGDTLRAGVLKPEWLADGLREKRVQIGHTLVRIGQEPSVVLTAPTEEIRAFLKRVVREENAFSIGEYHRVK